MLDDFAIGERLMVYRLRRGYTKTQLAKLVGVSVSTISKYERRDFTDYDIDIIAGISAALNISVNRVIYGFEDPEKKTDKSHILGWK